MRRLRPTVLLAAGPLVVAALVGVALAASLGLSSDSAGTGDVTVPRCVTTGIDVRETINTTSPGSITGATISNLDSGCAGATLAVTANNGTSTSSTSATIPSGGGTVTVTFSPTLSYVSNAEIDAVVTGP